MSVEVRALAREDFAAWWPLFSGYCEFYRVTPDESRAQAVFERFFDDEPPLYCLVAVADGELIGFTHFKRYFESLSAAYEVNLDDLFVAPSARGRGVGRALIEAVCQAASNRQATLVRWITAADNLAAQRLYDQLAKRTSWVTYEIEL